jgi:hypothetical protein
MQRGASRADFGTAAAEVEDLHVALLGDEDVPTLDVAMDNPAW